MRTLFLQMFDQTQPFQTAFSRDSPHLLSRRKLSFPNGEKLFRGSPAGLDSGCSPEPFSGGFSAALHTETVRIKPLSLCFTSKKRQRRSGKKG